MQIEHRMDAKRGNLIWLSDGRTEAAAAAITAADIAADGTVTDRRTSLMRKSKK